MSILEREEVEQTLKEMEEDGLLERKVIDGEDRYRLTPKGMEYRLRLKYELD
jgi:DNA-binding HxlR family transcriptional regulator